MQSMLVPSSKARDKSYVYFAVQIQDLLYNYQTSPSHGNILLCLLKSQRYLDQLAQPL